MRYKNPLGALVFAGMTAAATSAYAVDLDDNPPVPAQYASEIVVLPAPTGTALTGDTGVLDVESQIGFQIIATDNHSFRFDLVGGVFTTNPDLDVPNAVSSRSTGGAGSNFIIFDVVGGAGGVPDTEIMTLFNVNVTVFDQSGVTVEFGNYQSAGEASSKTNVLYDATGDLLVFDDALRVTAEPVIPLLIDVATNSTEFVLGQDTTIIGRVEGCIEGLTCLPPSAQTNWTDGEQTESADLLTAPNTVVVTGDFGAARDTDTGDFTGTDGSVFADATGGCDDEDVQASAAPGGFDGVTANLVNAGPGAIFGWDICYRTNGEDEIVDGPITGIYATNALPATSNVPDIDLGVLSVLEKNGDSEFINLGLTPASEGGRFRQWFRVCNRTGVDGRVFMRLWNDVGDTVGFALGDIAGQIGNELGALECTAQLLVDDVYAAGQSVDNTFSVGPAGRAKLRLLVEGEFSELDVDSLTSTRDNQGFYSLP